MLFHHSSTPNEHSELYGILPIGTKPKNGLGLCPLGQKPKNWLGHCPLEQSPRTDWDTAQLGKAQELLGILPFGAKPKNMLGHSPEKLQKNLKKGHEISDLKARGS